MSQHLCHKMHSQPYQVSRCIRLSSKVFTFRDRLDTESDFRNIRTSDSIGENEELNEGDMWYFLLFITSPTYLSALVIITGSYRALIKIDDRLEISKFFVVYRWEAVKALLLAIFASSRSHTVIHRFMDQTCVILAYLFVDETSLLSG